MKKAEIVDYIIKSRSDRDAVEVDNWAKHKKTFYSEWYILFYLQADRKKTIGHELISLFSFIVQKYSSTTLI
jgi:hypothetical protein